MIDEKTKKQQIESMDYLQYIVYKAMCNNPNIDEYYARDFALNRINKPVDLVRLDYNNLDFLAKELDCTPYQLDVFIMITKAIYNSGKCENTIEADREYAKNFEEIMKDHIVDNTFHVNSKG